MFFVLLVSFSFSSSVFAPWLWPNSGDEEKEKLKNTTSSEQSNKEIKVKIFEIQKKVKDLNVKLHVLQKMLDQSEN